MEPIMRIFWALILLGTIVTTSDMYKFLKKSNSTCLRFLRFPIAVSFPALVICAYYILVDSLTLDNIQSLTLGDIQTFLQEVEKDMGEYVNGVVHVFLATPPVGRVLLIQSLLMTCLLKIAGPLKLHPPTENGKFIMITSVALFVVHWVFFLMFTIGAYGLIYFANFDDNFFIYMTHGIDIMIVIGFLALMLKSCFKRRAITAPSLNRAALNAPNSNRK